jgi:nitrous oxidase accessory protein
MRWGCWPTKAMRGLCIFLLCLQCTSVMAAEWTVRPGESIQRTIDAAASGDVVKILRGRYAENLVVPRPLTLRGIDRPTISGGLKGDVIRVKSPDVIIEDLIVTDSGDDLGEQNAGIYITKGSDRAIVRRCDVVYSLFGLWIEGVKDVRIIGNLITGKRDLASVARGNGIQLYNTQGALIEGNNISFARDALYVDVTHHAIFRGNRMHHSRYGTHYMTSFNNVWENNETYLNRGGLALMEVRDQIVRNNRAWGNSDHGIMLRTIQDSVIENNVVAGNARGFFIYDAEYNTLRNNLVVGNAVGVHLWAGSTRNEVEGNHFIQNQEQIRYVASRDEYWGVKSGNYWGNYLGWDRDGDGIGDVPYEANDLVDRLIWRQPVVRLLMGSPAIQTLRMIARQFPLLRATSVVDNKPHMKPTNPDWRQWIERIRH